MIKFTTRNTEFESGNSRLSKYTFSGKNGRKFFTILNDGVTTVSITFSLSEPGRFRIFPSNTTATLLDTVSIILSAGEQSSFSVDYDYTWGSNNSVSLISSLDIYTSDGTTVLVGPTTPITFDFLDNTIRTRRELGILFAKDEDSNYQIGQISTKKITEDETSFGIARTNPKLTGNVKITVDSSNNIWLNSIDAVKELSDDRFKKFQIGSNSSYASDIKRFFDNGITPPELVYAVYQADSQYISTKRNLSEQYDKFYQYGVTMLNDKLYDEDYSFFAPIYVKTEIPEYFVIFRTTGSTNKFSYYTSEENWSSNVADILKDSQIIKTFDLGENTQIGSYIRNIVNHPSRTETDLTISFQQNGYTTYNGISYTKGSFTNSGELMYDYFSQENPLISTEEYVSLGFERNKVLSSHILNLEFLFDDSNAENYSINRYFGLYVNAIDLANFSLSDTALQYFSLNIGQLPLPRKNVDGSKISQKSFVQTNTNGISIFAESDSIKRTNNITSKSFTSTISRIVIDSTIKVYLEGDFTNRILIGDEFRFTQNGSTATAIVDNFSLIKNGQLIDETEIEFLTSTYVSDMTLPVFASFADTMKCDFYTESKYKNLIKKIFDNNFVKDYSRLFYVKDNSNNLHSIKSTDEHIFSPTSFIEENVVELTIKDTKLDISKLGGFNNLLTQCDAKLLTKGKSSMVVEVKDYFCPNDFMEVSWKNGNFSTKWRVIANETDLFPGESWPNYVLSDENGNTVYTTYFHPGNSTILLSQLANSIQNAFNYLPVKNFEIVAKNNKLYFRTISTGLNSNTEIFTFSTTYEILNVLDVITGKSGSANFIGGSDRNYTRAKITTDVAKGLLKTEYVSTSGSFSLAKQYTILNEVKVFAPYLEEPVYNDLDELVDFNGCDTYSVICLENESAPIQLTSDKQLTTYEIFSPAFGILSIMPFKDFDTDYFFSEYSKTYNPELIEYFGRYSSSAIISNVQSSTITFDKSFSFDSYPIDVPYLTIYSNGILPGVLHNMDCQMRFYEEGTTASIMCNTFTPTIGDEILLMPENKAIYYSDNELVKFKGFVGLSSVVSSDDETEFQQLENKWDPTRFIIHSVSSEYERLMENNLKSFVLKSRVVPYISKWVSPQGKDIRDNQYRFNYHRSFGNMNFSPADQMYIPDPKFHTHEWPYLDSIPDSFQVDKFPEYTFSYMFDSIDSKYDFSSLKRDWFSEYFTTGYPTDQYELNNEYISAKIEPTEKYSYFNYQNFNDDTTTLFRGYKFSIREIDSLSNTIKLSNKYNNYRFSVIIETKEDTFGYNEPIIFKTIVNEKWKFMLLKITVYTSSYRFSTGKLKYVDLYTLSNNDEIAEYETISILPSFRLGIPTDRKLSSPINFSAYSNDNSLVSPYQFYDTYQLDIDNYVEDLNEEILELDNGLYSNLISVFDTNSFYKVCVTLSAPSYIYSRKTLRISNSDAYLKLASLPAPIKISLPFSSNNWKDFTVYHESGGANSFSGLRSRLSFAEILKVIEGTSDKSIMNYEIYKEDGTVSNTPNFAISGISPESLLRTSDYYPVADTDKPQQFYSIPVIGSVLAQEKDYQSIYRYQGNFSPKFRNILKFWLREDSLFTDISGIDFLLLNTHIGSELPGFSVLKNQFYQKVSDQEILRLSLDSGYQPVYPLIGEIVIDKKDVFAWSSSWDKNYYRKYTSVTNYNEVNGTQEMTEQKSLFGSKAIKLPKSYDLYEFLINNNEFNYSETTNTITINVNVYERLLRELMGTIHDPKVKTEFNRIMSLIPEAFDSTTVDQYVKKYIETNIMNLFEISDISFYTLVSGNDGTVSTLSLQTPRPTVEFTENINLEHLTLSETSLLSKGYFIKNDVKIVNTSPLSFSVKYTLDSRYYTSVSIGVKVKRI